MLKLLKGTMIFAVIYFITSMVLFTALFLLWPGFPFFPKIVAQSNNEIISSVHLSKGVYYIQFFIDGAQTLQTGHGDVGPIKVEEIKSDGKRETLAVQLIQHNHHGPNGVRAKFTLSTRNRPA